MYIYVGVTELSIKFLLLKYKLTFEVIIIKILIQFVRSIAYLYLNGQLLLLRKLMTEG